MGADILYLSPCCHSEDWEFFEDNMDWCKCNICGKMFSEESLLQETIDYGDEEATDIA